MARLRDVFGLIAASILILSSASHSFLGWKQLHSDLTRAQVSPDLPQGLRMGWLFGGVAMLAFGIIATMIFTTRPRGLRISTMPATVIGLAYLTFGIWAIAVSRYGSSWSSLCRPFCCSLPRRSRVTYKEEIMRRFIALLVLAAVATVPLLAKDSRKELTVNLKFSPQEGVDSESPDLPAAMLERTLELRVDDGRGGDDALVVGKGTNDDDQVFVIKANGDVMEHVKGVLQQVATGWGLKTGDAADRILKVTVTRFDVEESNKAVGSTYSANVRLSAALTDRAGKKLAEASGSGEANRYGRARSSDNCSEVLSDATKEAFANVLGDAGLQSAWTSGKSSGKAGGESGNKESVEERLRKLDDLLKKKLITKEEYDKKRAEILKDV